MKTRSLIAILSIISLISCTEIIDINLNDTNPKLVIEAQITLNQQARVKLSLTSNYFSSDSALLVNNAHVYIYDNKGNQEELTSLGQGKYQSFIITGKENIEYTLKVDYNQKVYSAQSYLHPPLEIDTIYTEESYRNPHSFTDGKIVSIQFKDKGNQSNYYRINYFRNDTLVSTPNRMNILDDNFSNGLNIIVSSVSVNYQTGDFAKVELQEIDKHVYTYFSSLADILSSDMMNSGTPYNPESNFDNDALGYFAALSSSTKEILIN